MSDITTNGISSLKRILFLREYLDFDGLLKGDYDDKSTPSPLDTKSKGLINDPKEEKWAVATKNNLKDVSEDDKKAFIDLFKLKGADGAPLDPAKLKAETISQQVLTDKRSTKDLIGAICRLDGSESFCPALTPPVKMVKVETINGQEKETPVTEIKQGDTNIKVTVSGTNIPEGGKIEIYSTEPGTGAIEVDPASVVLEADAKSLSFLLPSVPANAPVGKRTIKISGSDGYLSAILPDAFELKNNGITLSKVEPYWIEPGTQVQIVVTGENLKQVQDVTMPDALKTSNPQIPWDGKTMTFDKLTVPKKAEPGIYKFFLWGELIDPSDPNSKRHKLGEFSVAILQIGENRFPRPVRQLKLEAEAGLGHRAASGVSPLAQAENQNDVPSAKLRVGLAPLIFGKKDEGKKDDPYIASKQLTLRANGYAEIREAVKGAGAGLNAGYEIKGFSPEFGLRYDAHKYDYSVPNLQFFNGSSQQLAGRAGLKGDLHGWLTGRLYAELASDWRNYDGARVGGQSFSGRDQALKYGLTVDVDLAKKLARASAPDLALEIGYLAHGYRTVPESIPADGASRETMRGYNFSLKADWTGYKTLLPYAAFGYQKETLATWFDTERLYGKVGTGEKNGLGIGKAELEIGKMNQNHYYPFGSPFYAQVRWTEPWARVFSLGLGFDRFNDLATNQKINAYSGQLSANLYRLAEMIGGTKQLTPSNNVIEPPK
jgi:hypothetical protein